MKPAGLYNRHPSRRLPSRWLREKTARVLDLLDLRGASVELTLCDDAFMILQNRRHMKKRGTTDVLSFPQMPPQKRVEEYRGRFLGDILISLDQALRQARQQKIPLRDEVLFLTVHGILHLIGLDHAGEDERREMQRLESLLWLELKGR